MSTGTLKIQSENILPIIKKWLYSDKDIFVRELVSNACDAIHKLKLLRDRGEAPALDDTPRIDVQIDKEAGTLTFIDTGLGMDQEEIETYIAQVAFSGAEDFLKKYETKDMNDQMIGHFGLGFYSAFMIAQRVEIDSLSYKEGSSAAHWTCDGSADYEMSEGSRTERGTTITLHVNEEEKEYLDASRIREILDKYCAFLPYPIYLNDAQINHKEPLWTKSPANCTEQEYLDFYRQLYPMEEAPLFWIHLNVDYPFHLKGILYFPHVKRDFDFSKNNIKLFCNRVFVSDDCKELIPDYLMVLRGAIDSPDIPLNVSRSYLQMDRTVRQVGMHISKKVSDRLNALYRDDREKFVESWKDIETIIKLGAIQDPKFYDRVKSFMIFRNLEDEWTTIDEYLERNQGKMQNKVYYSMGERQDSHIIELYRSRGIEVLRTNPLIDNHIIHFLEGKLSPVKFHRIDSAVDENILDKEREKTILDAEGKTEASKVADFVKQQLQDESVDVEAKSLASEDISGFVMLDEQSRRMRDLMQSTAQGSELADFHKMAKRTFVVNTNNPFFAAVQKLAKTNSSLASELIQEVYNLSLLSQREMPPAQLDAFIKQTHSLLQRLAQEATKE